MIPLLLLAVLLQTQEPCSEHWCPPPKQEDVSYSETPAPCPEGQHPKADHFGGMKCTADTEQVAVWDANCVKALSPSADTTVEAPIGPNGKPDLSQLKLVNPVIALDKSCAYAVITRKVNQ